MEKCCGKCRHLVQSRDELERELPGLTILGSAYGDTMGDQRICRLHSVLTCPGLSCELFEPDEDLAAGQT